MLRPAEILRLRDLIQLGPLRCCVETDLALAQAGLAEPMKFTYDLRDSFERIDRSRVALMQALVKEVLEDSTSSAANITTTSSVARFDAWTLVRATNFAKGRFYNRQGGIAARWWKASGKTFAAYMANDQR